MEKQKINESKDGFQLRGKKWSYRFRVPDPTSGKTKEVRISGFLTKAEAKSDRVKREAEVQERGFIKASKETVEVFFSDWLETKIAKGKIKLTTASQYRQAIFYYINPNIGKLHLKELTPENLEQFLIRLIRGGKKNGSPLSQATVRLVAIVLSQGLDQAVRYKKLFSNPMSEVEKPKGKTKSVSTYSASEIRSLLSFAENHRLYAFFHLACHTGARRGELLALRWSDFDTESQTISISKTRGMIGKEIIEGDSTKTKNGNRKVEITPETVKSLKAHKARQAVERLQIGSGWVETNYIFVQENGEPLYPTTPYLIFRKMINKLGLRPEPFHSLRHSHATELLRAGIPAFIVAKRIGDHPATVLSTYAHAQTEDGHKSAKAFEEQIANA